MTLEQICNELQALQRQRTWFIKSRIMVENRLRMTIAGMLGYSTGLPEADRKRLIREADAMIKEPDANTMLFVTTTGPAIESFDAQAKAFGRSMVKLVRELPIIEWVEKPEQRGYGEMNLAVTIGESGDLNNYTNPAKLWKRLGCAPIEHRGQRQMGSTWRKAKGLPAEVWTEAGYSPRRRAIAFMIGDGLIKQNQTGPYRRRYDEAKETIQVKHPDYSKQRCHLHGSLLCTKLLLKNLWIAWRDY